MDSPIVEMRDILKRFPGVVANDRVHFELCAGEVHALLGENGAGKSTLMNILSGFYRADAGEISVRGKPVNIRSPGNAIALGIGMIHQQFRLIPTFTVTENIVLGLSKLAFSLDIRAMEADVGRFSRSSGLTIDPRALIWQLSVGELQRVEILKVLYRGVDILIMDEPTAVLTPQEVKELFHVTRAMAESGKTVVFITHRLEEVMEIADRITVLRGGRNVATLRRSETSIRELAVMMVGKALPPDTAFPPAEAGDIVLELENIEAGGDRGQKALDGLSLSVRAGEIVGIAGVAGNGQRELAEVIAGLRSVSRGTIRVCGKDITNREPLCAIEAGVSYIPEDRFGTGLAGELSVEENLILKEYRHAPLGRGFLIDWKKAAARALELVEQFHVKTPSLGAPANSLSGGNAQRLLLARETAARPKLIIAAQPSRGLDVRATEAVRTILDSQRRVGAAVLLISGDLDEIMKLSDRVAVIFEGRIMGIRGRDRLDMEAIGLMMGGLGESHDQA